MDFLLISWNCNGLLAHWEDFKLLLYKYKPSIIALQETHLKPSFKPQLTNYIIYSKPLDNQFAQGGVLITVHNSLASSAIPLSTNLQLIAVSVHTPRYITFGSIYLPLNTPFQSDEIHPFLQANNAPKILARGYNAHNPLGTSQKYNSNGRQLENLLMTSYLALHFPHDITHFNFTHKVWSTLDLNLVSSSLLTDLHIYGHQDLAGSDHRPIITHTSTTNSTSPSFTRPFSYKKTNWTKFRSLCSSSCIFTDSRRSRRCNSIFLWNLVNLAQACSPLTRSPSRHRLVPWWNKNCQTVPRNRRKALQKVQRNPSQENLINFRTMRAIAKRTFK